MQLKLLWKAAEATSDLIGNKTADKITKNSLQNDSDTDTQTEKSIEIPEKNTFSRKKSANYWWSKINIII